MAVSSRHININSPRAPREQMGSGYVLMMGQCDNCQGSIVRIGIPYLQNYGTCDKCKWVCKIEVYKP